ncbi:MAG: hypothetical protein FWE71_02670 [Nocardioidaceae bacterium]|nr:hypothetical protein [Nocardioidaceae bacterium]MCL2613788.1 hypothetical protein [Nocardioidaceae bacterium]
MTVSATEGVTSPFSTTPASSATSAGSGTGSLGDQNTFLQLMVAQMQYQDPMNPTDSSQFLSQTAQFTSLEKMQDVADQTALLAQSQMAFGATSMIGKTVRWTDDSGTEQTGTVGGTTFLSTGPVLSVNGTAVPLTSITSVGDAATLPATSPTGDASTPVGTPPDGFGYPTTTA